MVSLRSNPPEDVSVSLLSTDNKAFDVVVLDFDGEERHGSVLLDVPRSENFSVPVGESATLVFSARDPERAIQVRGRVIFQSESGSAIRYEFQLDESETRRLNELVERREAERVRCDPVAPVRVILQGDGGGPWVQVSLRDLSENGLSVLVDRDQEALLYSAWKLRLSLCLPGEDKSVDVVGHVRYRRLADSAIQYGIEFDAGESPDFDRQQARLLAYVDSRRDVRRDSRR